MVYEGSSGDLGLLSYAKPHSPDCWKTTGSPIILNNKYSLFYLIDLSFESLMESGTGKRDALEILNFRIDMKAINDKACQDWPNSTHQMFYNTL
jgi:hypothetical protein